MKGRFILDFIPCVPYRIFGLNRRVEYAIRLVRIERIPDVLNIIDEKGLSVLVDYMKNLQDSTITA